MKNLKKQESVYIQGICVVCNKNKQTLREKGKYRSICQSCHTKRNPEYHARQKEKLKIRRYPYGVFKKDFCECCGFIAVNPCQLDVDHINGNHNDNSVDNLQTLCANCHRLKTHLNRDWEY